MKSTEKFVLVLVASLGLLLAGCGGGSSTTTMMPDPDPGPTPNPAEERSAIQMALNAATTALAAVGAGDSATEAQIMAAEAAVMQARAAIDAADDLSDAEIAQHNAALMLINDPLMMARSALDERQRSADVGAARMAAHQSYMDADGSATNAETAAAAAEAAAPGSTGAMAARTAATAARMAADAAKAAHDAITDGMTKAQADAQAATAATEAMTAMSHYMTAMRENNTIQTAAAAAGEQQRMSDVADAKEAAATAVMAAMAAKDAANTAATAAETARDAARAAYMRAMAARTDSETARMEYMEASAAATAARAAANEANTAYMAAMSAHDGIDDGGSVADAQSAQMTAETQQGNAETAQGTAESEQMTAETAQGDAEMAAATHVLRLFQAANGAHVMDDESTMEVDETAAHVTSVGAALATIAAVADGAQAGGTTATATWTGNNVDNPATMDTDESTTEMLSIAVDPGGSGTAIPFNLVAAEEDDTDTADINESIQTARKIADLGVFQGYELWEDDEDATTATDRARAIVFTNKQQGDDQVLAVAEVAARSVVGETITAPGELSNVRSSGRTITGVTWTPSGQAPLMGTLTCGDTCDITLGEDGAVTAIEGYTFTGSRAAVEEVTAADATDSHEYLIFGLWLDESADGNTDTIGAFADGGVVGGTDYAVSVQNAVTGTATYTGNAAGAHHKTGEGVNWFHGDARLTANFGAIDTDAERGTDPPADTTPGTISGEISNIRLNGGDPMSDSIVLRQAALMDGTATFNGNARMGAGEIQADDTVMYPYNGTWSGSFYGATADDTDTTDVNESVTAPLATAGTFGVTMSEGTGDDMVVESFVGAFGAHLDD